MSAREDILKSVRRHLPVLTELPAPDQQGVIYDDPLSQFQATLSAVGGSCVTVATVEDLQTDLKSLPPYADAVKRVSLVSGVGEPTVSLDDIADPHDLASVDFAVLPAEFAVAENGAVWVQDAQLKHRVIYFIPQHLAFVVPANEVVHNMHQAYERLSFGQRSFGAFISGPSKTADIEQSLVIGAHGPRSTTIYLLG